MKHGRVVNAAVFSPSGRKILTTCQDNRLRVWDNLLACGGPPSREVVHSHDFNRYLTPFKAEWFATDPSESLILCGRYISEDYSGVALHPVDIIDASTGRLLAALADGHLTTITPVNLPHPRLDDVIISGSSRSLYKWVPQSDDEDSDTDLDASEGTNRGRGLGAAAAAAAATMAAAAAAGVARRAAGVSDHFVCFDADPQGGGSKGGSKSKTKTSPAAAAAAGRGSKSAAGGSRKRGRRSKEAESEQEEEGPDSDADD